MDEFGLLELLLSGGGLGTGVVLLIVLTRLGIIKFNGNGKSKNPDNKGNGEMPAEFTNLARDAVMKLDSIDKGITGLREDMRDMRKEQSDMHLEMVRNTRSQ